MTKVPRNYFGSLKKKVNGKYDYISTRIYLLEVALLQTGSAGNTTASVLLLWHTVCSAWVGLLCLSNWAENYVIYLQPQPEYSLLIQAGTSSSYPSYKSRLNSITSCIILHVKVEASQA